MAFLPPQDSAPAKPGQAILLGSLVAIGSAFVVGLISGSTNTEFAISAILIGFLVGVTMRNSGRDMSIWISAAIISLIGSALSSVIALILHIVKVGQIPLSFVLGHLSTVLSEVPHYIGGLGFFFWALAAYVGGATAAGRMRRGRRPLLGRRLPAGPGGPGPQPYGGPGPQPYGGPGPQPYGGPGPEQYGGAGPQPYGGMSPQPYGAPWPQPYDAPTQQPYGTPPGGPGWVPGAPEQPPGPTMPPAG